jgi:hypothetical protein
VHHHAIGHVVRERPAERADYSITPGARIASERSKKPIATMRGSCSYCLGLVDCTCRFRPPAGRSDFRQTVGHLQHLFLSE